MKLFCNITLCYTVFIFGMYGAVYASKSSSEKINRIVKVLLKESSESSICKIEADTPLIFFDGQTKKRILKNKKMDSVRITQNSSGLFINGFSIKTNSLIIKASKKGPLIFDKKKYKGTFQVIRSENRAYFLNRIDRETYLELVLQSESWPGWPLEVNMAFAIASRSYVVAMMERMQNMNVPFDVRDTNVHQRYNLYGVEPSEVIKEAVKRTYGIILTYNNEPIIAMFDACCGGIIPAHIEDGIDFQKAPYLAREHSCPYCKKCSAYNWKIAYDQSYIELALLKKIGKKIFPIKDIKVTKKDKAGLVKEVQIKGKQGIVTLAGKQIYSLLDAVKSYCFHVEKKASQFIFSGFGLGHHVGLCQWGARQMVREGLSYRQILSFYYPNTQLKRLKS